MSLNSTSVIEFIDLLCEGPIEGLIGEKQGIFLEETPIKSGNKLNFKNDDVTYDFKPGGKTQDALDQGKKGASTITDVATEVGENYSETLDNNNEVIARDYGKGSVTRQVTDTDVESVQLLFTIPRLFSTAQEGLAKGQLFSGKIKFEVYVQAQGEAFVEVYSKTVKGVAVSDYQFKTPSIELDGQGPWNIRVKKVNLKEDHFEVKFANFKDTPKTTPLANGRANRIVWTSIIEFQSLRTGYPFCAVAGLSLSTRQFASLPTRAYKIRGKIVQMPSNAVVRKDGSLDFQGPFSGGLKEGWTTCPVCCWYDMLVNPRYGAGDFVQAANVSWVDLYPLAQYANQLVTNPDGTTEPRFSCNVVIGKQAEAFSVLQDLASVFRGMLYWQANTIQATGDHGNLDGSDVVPVHLYTNSNVIDGVFNYSGSSLKTRSTKITVRYNDPENFYKTNYVCVEDAALIAKYGYKEKEIVGFGCTSKFQAQRLGRWMLTSEELDGEVVKFVTGLQGAVVLPGQVFAVSDEVRQGVRLAGRVSSATTTQITVDQTVDLPDGGGEQLTCTLADGSIETKAITSVFGSVITTQAFSSVPLAQSVWSITATAVEHQKFRCLSVADNGEGKYAISGVQFSDSIYSTADLGDPLEFEDVTLINDAPAEPINLALSFKGITIGQTITNRMTASWSRGLDGASFYFEVRYKYGDGNFINAETTNTIYEVDGFPEGSEVVFQLRSVGAPPVSKKSAWIDVSGIVPVPDVNPDNPNAVLLPPVPSDVTLQAIEGDQVILRWKIPPTGLNKNNLLALIRHAPQVDGTGEWPNSTLLTEVTAQTTSVVLPLIEGEYLVKFQDENGQRSPSAASAVIDLPNALPRLNIDTRREDLDLPPFQGNKDGVFYSEEYDGLVLDGDADFDSLTDVNTLTTSERQYETIDDMVGTRLAAGEYFFRDTLDLGGVFNVVFTRKMTSSGLYPEDTFDDRIELIDRWSDIDGDIPDDTTADMYFRTSDQATVNEQLLLEDGDFFLLEDGTNKIEMESDIDFGDWVPMESGRFTARQFQFKAALASSHIDQTPVVTELGYIMQMESRTEKSVTILSGAAAKVVTFTNAFYEEPGIGITAFNLDTGDYYVVSSASRTGFTIAFFNDSGDPISRQFQYQAVGFGTEQT